MQDLIIALEVILALTYTFSGIIIVGNIIVYKFPRKMTIWNIITLILYLPVTLLTSVVSAIVFFINWIRNKISKDIEIILSRRFF